MLKAVRMTPGEVLGVEQQQILRDWLDGVEEANKDILVKLELTITDSPVARIILDPVEPAAEPGPGYENPDGEDNAREQGAVPGVPDAPPGDGKEVG